eukprot:TRINITY_DN12185_c0_g2_i1.p3 TRINITY_DN12185_c0_g2~~TRINITY_DN12185_c0_g2_i1.p3  ORF type:complete len:159 (-),score=38.18 TRINITY_DN12185_c0_g2_i1:2912-3388(-)
MLTHKTRGAGMPLPVPGFEEFGAKPTIEVVVNSPTESGTVPPHMQLVDLTVAQNGGVDAADDDEDEFDEDWDGNDWEAPPSTAVDNSVSIKVRALYDYHAEDPEELSLTAGDIVAQVRSLTEAKNRLSPDICEIAWLQLLEYSLDSNRIDMSLRVRKG